MTGHRRKSRGRKQPIDVSKRTTADQRQRSARTCEEAVQGLRQASRHAYLARRRREIEQRTVDVKENGDLGQTRREMMRVGNEVRSCVQRSNDMPATMR